MYISCRQVLAILYSLLRILLRKCRLFPPYKQYDVSHITNTWGTFLNGHSWNEDQQNVSLFAVIGAISMGTWLLYASDPAAKMALYTNRVATSSFVHHDVRITLAMFPGSELASSTFEGNKGVQKYLVCNGLICKWERLDVRYAKYNISAPK